MGNEGSEMDDFRPGIVMAIVLLVVLAYFLVSDEFRKTFGKQSPFRSK